VPPGPTVRLTVLRELRPRDTEEQVRRMVDLRMQRQRLLDQDSPLEAWIILDEGAIRRNIGGEAIGPSLAAYPAGPRPAPESGRPNAAAR
jgi:hypothetical protein